MELWIRSQDREHLMKTTDVDISVDDKTIILINNYEMAKYKTKERALEVLDEIQIRIINLQLVGLEEKGQARKDARINDELKCIYEMPEE